MTQAGRSPAAEVTRVPVAGGGLAVGCWPGAGTPVLAVHGITASHAAWGAVARHRGGVHLVAPDLRGRGGSADLPGPYGMAAHADDLAAVLDRLGIEQAVVAGHSMGGFVATVFADRHPSRVSRLVLIDGGLPLPPPLGLDPDQVLQAVLGPAVDRLSATFPDPAAYRALWRAHPAFVHDWNNDAAAYVDYDLRWDPSVEPPVLRPSTPYAVVRADSIDLHTGDAAAGALARLRHPTTFLRAERGMLDQPAGLYPPDTGSMTPDITASTVPSVNHYSILLSDTGARHVADAIRAAREPATPTRTPRGVH